MKKQNFYHFIGIDISKSTFDVAIIRPDKTHCSYVFDNNNKGIKSFLKLLKDQKIKFSQTLVCLEHTGIYGRLIISKLVANGIHTCIEMSLRIIRSQGVQRGKNDKIDAIRIAKYALKNADELELYAPLPKVLEKIKVLMSIREGLIKSKAALSKYPKELKHFASDLSKLAENNIKKTIKTITNEIKRINSDIQKLIKSDEQVNKTIKLATSVTGIGVFTALYFAIYTNMFTRYKNPKQLACYCGVVPFEHSSGTSIKKKPRVSHMANKKLKKQLHMCAMAAMVYDPDLKDYYNRKVEEGKSKMLVINNIRNKLILRVCAVIKRQQPYQKSIA